MKITINTQEAIKVLEEHFSKTMETEVTVEFTGDVGRKLLLIKAVRETIENKNKIQAIKDLRAHTNMGLADTKAIVDGIIDGEKDSVSIEKIKFLDKD